MSSKVAIVTGASQGIGRSTAIRLARDFASVVVVARNREILGQTADEVRKAGAEALPIDLDLSDPQAAQKVVDQTLSAFGQIDALLNVAGAVPQIDVFEMSDAQWDRGFALKLPGPVMTGRRQSYLEHWAPLHNMTVEEATAGFPVEAGIARYGTPEEIAELMAFIVSPAAHWMTGSTLRMDGGEVKSI
ncbi:SDR family oxidoreductase [Paraburkholderia sediminicola]|uniref:SDR family oxidoreductase n=1 Tax=Paraburkholderia sediminicola TaxID=458836 RepID=UPI0038B9F956